MANLFPRSTNFLIFKIAFCIGVAKLGVMLAFSYYATDKTIAVGYQPDQPIPYDHEFHASQLGLDCRHCHSFADKTGQANIPSANVCWNCHGVGKGGIKADSPKLAPLREAMETGKPIRWVKVWDSPDYVYFDHSAHLNRGISCVSCHGEIHKMRKVYKSKAHTMGFCIDCHNAPENHLRPVEEVTNMDFSAKDYLANNKEVREAVENFHKLGLANKGKDNPLKFQGKKYIDFEYDEFESEANCQKALGLYLKDKHSVHPKISCQTCHN